MKYCTHCGKEINDEAVICTGCGCEIESKITKNHKNIFKRFASWINKSKKNLTIFLITIIITLSISISVPIIINNNKLSGDDLLAYNLIVENSTQFYDPSSVRIVSGCIYYDKEEKSTAGWFVISAKNGFGARKTEEYFMMLYNNGEKYAVKAETIKSTSNLYYKTDELNIDKINKKLDNKWKSF